MATETYNPKREKEQEVKSNIDFFVRHLSLTELKILEKLALELANSYSESYRKWKYEPD